MDAYINSIASESARIAELIPNRDPDRRVPSCPEWTFRDLVVHTGGVQRFWAETVLAADPSTRWDGDWSSPSASDDLHQWFQTGSSMLVEAIRSTAAETPCWTWWGEPLTTAAVARHQVQEVVVHRWDAELASGSPQPIASAIADDGVDEFLSIMLGDTDALPHSISLRATDTGSKWRVGPEGEPAVSLSATASDLVLLLYRRVPLSNAEVVGDVSVFEALVHNTPAS